MPDLDLNIPRTLRTAIATIDGLSDASFDSLLKTLQRLNPVASSDEVIQSLSDQAGLSSQDILRIIAFAMSTRRLLVSVPAEAAPTVADAVVDAYVGERAGPSDALRQRITALLELDFVALREKATRLASEAESRLRGATTFTDLRPVFSPQGSSDLVGFLVINTLKLEVVRHGESESLYLLLDSPMLEQLSEAVDRAQTKAAVLTDLVDKLGTLNLTAASSSDDQ